MKDYSLARAAVVAVFGATLFAGALPAAAQDDPNDSTDVDRACIMACRDSERDCRFDAREAYKLCLEESGCDALAADYRATCLVDDRDEEACATARTALRECREPCHEAASASKEECRTAFQSCLLEQCGIEELPHPGHHGPRPGRGPGGHHGRR